MTKAAKLPTGNIYITEAKLTQYLLLELPKDDKSKFLAQGNYTLENWHILRNDLDQLAQLGKPEQMNVTPYGTKYKIRGELRGLKVITIWMVVEDSAKFVTLIPDKGAE